MAYWFRLPERRIGQITLNQSGKSIPLVFFDRIMEDLNASQVFTENYEVALEGTEHLIAQGCKRIAIMAGPSIFLPAGTDSAATWKHSGEITCPFRSPISCIRIINNRVEESTRYLINLPQPPDAVFAINDYTAIEMMHIMKETD